jgi:predicted permease
MREVLRQLSAALRSLSRQPAVMLPALVTLALGIGAITALFTYLAFIVWPTIDAPAPERIVWVHSGTAEDRRAPFPYAEYLEIRRLPVLSDVTAWSRFGSSLTDGEQNLFAWGHLVAGNYFSFFGTQPGLGRLIQPTDDRPDAAPVVVLGHHFWQGSLGGDPGVVGRELRINGIGVTVIGVTRAGFQGEGLASAFYVPASLSDRLTGVARLADRGNRWLSVLGRLAPGVSEARAQAALGVLGRAFDAAAPLEERKPRRLSVVAATRNDPEVWDASFVDAARVLMAVATLFLLLGCASIANLLLARAVSKQREWGIRASLGASRARLMSGVLAESLVLCLAGGGLGLVVAAGLQKRIEDYIAVAPGSLGNWGEGTEVLTLDPRSLAFGLLVTVLCAALGALGPVLRVMRGDLLVPLKSDASAAGTGGGMAPRQILVVAQVALSVLLLLGGGLLVRTLERARDVDPGFPVDDLLLVTVNVPRNVMNGPGGEQVYRRVLEEIRTRPGVAAATLTQVSPLSGFSRSVRVASAERPDQFQEVGFNSVAPHYFETLGIQVLAGRVLDERDHKDAPPVAVVSRGLARRLWGDGHALGRTVMAEDPLHDKIERYEVVGLVQDVHGASLIEPPGPMLYLSSEQKTHPRMTVAVRAAAAPASLAPELRRALREVHPDLSIVDFLSCREQIRRSLFPQQMYAEIAGLFALLGLAVAVVGVFGLLSYSVSLRGRELCIRMAVGARPRDVRSLVVRQGMALVGLGVAVGVAGSLALSRALASLLFGVGATDPLTFLTVPGALALVALLACWLPARRAARLDPSAMLRQG